MALKDFKMNANELKVFKAFKKKGLVAHNIMWSKIHHALRQDFAGNIEENVADLKAKFFMANSLKGVKPIFNCFLCEEFNHSFNCHQCPLNYGSNCTESPLSPLRALNIELSDLAYSDDTSRNDLVTSIMDHLGEIANVIWKHNSGEFLAKVLEMYPSIPKTFNHDTRFDSSLLEIHRLNFAYNLVYYGIGDISGGVITKLNLK